MPTPEEIMDAIRNGLDSLPAASGTARRKYRTEAIKAKLCEIGRNGFQDARFKVCATLPRDDRDYGEWLYDVVWRSYHEERDDHPLSYVPLVAECEWGSYEHVREDFQKLLLARASVRLMIYRDKTHHRHNGWQDAAQTAEQLAYHVSLFNGPVEEGWLLAAWRRIDTNPGFQFSYFTIGLDGGVCPL